MCKNHFSPVHNNFVTVPLKCNNNGISSLRYIDSNGKESITQIINANSLRDVVKRIREGSLEITRLK